ncbi:hypothetical protein SLEP1_g21761 [Rubroshorea leprosula]|uniref:Uncharacterized protein n=1 Tax=Rubroshorea leprosula TaxID=152421 RepID=A0AAV5JJ54_9ROSI|nr:hypothetical protein SLEP1_g21761 [Rubroshorea leprosula]
MVLYLSFPVIIIDEVLKLFSRNSHGIRFDFRFWRHEACEIMVSLLQWSTLQQGRYKLGPTSSRNCLLLQLISSSIILAERKCHVLSRGMAFTGLPV